MSIVTGIILDDPRPERPMCPTCGAGLYEPSYPADDGYYCRECNEWHQPLTLRQRYRMRRAAFRFWRQFHDRRRSKAPTIVFRSKLCD